MNTIDLAMKRVQLRKASSTNGGEWQGPCPACGGTDRFHVWPQQNEGKGGYWCRGCGNTGDNIQFLRDFEGLSFREACARLNVILPERPRSRGDRPAAFCAAPEFKPERHTSPADLWQEKAEKLVAWAQGTLAANADVLAWLSGRGIDAETAAKFRLGWNPGENEKDLYRPRKAWGLPEQLKDDGRPKALWIPRGLVIPYSAGGAVLRIRIRRPEGEPRYYVIPGSSMSTMVIGPERRAFVVVEAELDAIAVAASNTFLSGAVAMGSAAAKPDADTFSILRGALQILNALDYDAAGAKAMAWWTEHFKHCDRWPVPKGKDPGEAVRLGIDLRKWIEVGLPPALTIGSAGDTRENGAYIPSGMTRGISALAEAMENLDRAEPLPNLDHPAPILELWGLLKKNPGVKIINTPSRYTVLRDGKYVGGRINELVFKTPEVLDYITNHSAEEIDAGNFLKEEK
jgi:DNA primase